MASGGINTPLRVAAFVAQTAHESFAYRFLEELADGTAYEGRQDLGNTQPGDGPLFKGRGYIGITGRANYRRAGRDLGIDLEGNPQLAARPDVAAAIAVWFWNLRDLSPLADQGTQEAFDQITKKINGGFNGKASRDALWRNALTAIGSGGLNVGVSGDGSGLGDRISGTTKTLLISAAVVGAVWAISRRL
jgi:putative chitinase